MKYLLSVFFVVWIFIGKSQTYYPTGLDSTTYSVSCISTYMDPQITYWVDQYTFRGDTVINGKTYNQVYYGSNEIDTAYNITSTRFHYSYIFAVRDSAKKVYTINKNDSIERLMYDFNLLVGDTMRHYLGYFATSISTSVLYNIDSFLVNYPVPHYRKRYNYTADMIQFGEIEGMPTSFLIGPYVSIRTDACGVSCIQQKEGYIYKACDTCDCYALLDRHRKLALNENRRESQLKVYPNPFSDLIKIDFEENELEGVLKVLDVNGRILIEKSVNHNKSMKLDLTNFPPGMYVISIIGEDQNSFMKIVKEE